MTSLSGPILDILIVASLLTAGAISYLIRDVWSADP
jgi:hypothetical protein